jgi:hypothetical protein
MIGQKWLRGHRGENVVTKGLFGIAISISAILKITFLKSLLFKIAQVFGKTCLKVLFFIN